MLYVYVNGDSHEPAAYVKEKCKQSMSQLKKKLKLICRFNGAFHASPLAGRLCYNNGETRILWIDRNIVFSSLKSKIAELVYVNGESSFSLFYHLPVPESSEENVSPVLIASDGDVRRMIGDFEKIEFVGKPSRLWIFVCREEQGEKINGENLADRFITSFQNYEFPNAESNPNSLLFLDRLGNAEFSGDSVGNLGLADDYLTERVENWLNPFDGTHDCDVGLGIEQTVRSSSDEEQIAGIEESSAKESSKEEDKVRRNEIGAVQIEDSELEYIKELGSGTYGIVYHGKWRGSDVAIKKVKPICLAEGALDQKKLVTDFWKEAQMLRQVQHPNVVALYGVVSDGPLINWATVTEYMVSGSLNRVLRKKDRTIDRRKRLIIAMDAALGMEHLHEKNIVHFDLKSHNMFVNMKDPQRPVCKIGDLGLSRIRQNRVVAGGIRGTIRWMAPELLKSTTKHLVTEKIDVYSYGIVLWELLTGEEPYARMRSIEVIGGVIKGSLRPEIPNWCDPLWRSLMEKCWSKDPLLRPSFSEIVKELHAMAEILKIKF